MVENSIETLGKKFKKIELKHTNPNCEIVLANKLNHVDPFPEKL